MSQANDATLGAVLEAARALLAAREVDMLTAEEWDALEHAVAACDEPPADQRRETFAVEHGHLVRRVVPAPGRGRPYEHRCSQESFEALAAAVDDMIGRPFVLDEVRARAGLPWTQAAVAFAFLKERGCVKEITGRKHIGAFDAVYEDAMVEWHALREGAPGSR